MSSASSESGYCEYVRTEDEESSSAPDSCILSRPPSQQTFHPQTGYTTRWTSNNRGFSFGGNGSRCRRSRRKKPTACTPHYQPSRIHVTNRPKRERFPLLTSSVSWRSSSPLMNLPSTLEVSQSLAEDCLARVYLYFQQLLLHLRRHQRSLQRVASLHRDGDARWGAGGVGVDPSGCLWPPSLLSSTEQPHFVGYWATPHPNVCLALLIGNIQQYLAVLRRWLQPTKKTKISVIIVCI